MFLSSTSTFIKSVHQFRDKMWSPYKLHRHCLTLGYYPSSLKSYVGFLSVVIACNLSGNEATFGVSAHLRRKLFRSSCCDSLLVNTLSSYLGATAVWLVLCYIRKLVLKCALSYRGWMYEGKRMSLKTKIVLALVRILNGWFTPLTTQLYGLQGILPALPVPPLKQSVDKYLLSVKPLLSPKEYKQLEELAAEFMSGVGPSLQIILVLKSWIYPNYVTDWWEKYVYFSQRSSLLISSNYYCMESLKNYTRSPAAKAATISYWCLQIQKQIEDNKFQPVLGQDIIPLCTWQYERMWNTSRVPGETVDRLVHESFNYHVVAYSKGKFYKIKGCHGNDRNKLLSLPELQLQFQRVLDDDKSSPVAGEEKLGAFTAWDRVNWYKAREKYFSSGTNKRSLDAIEKATTIIFLDDKEYDFDFAEQDTQKFERYARALFHGEGYNRWLDKSVTFVVGKDGRAGANCEHSWGDAPVGCHAWEVCLSHALDYEGFDDKGRITAPVATEPPMPERLVWELPDECIRDIETAAAFSQRLIDDLDLKVLPFMDFGRGLMKRCGVSPDAYIQMALQLAYYRNQGKFDLTYEATMTRLYLQGRTETVRSCTEESSRWVLSVVNGTPKDKQISYFKEACERHQMNYRNAMSGKGIDRHVFALYVVGKYLEKDVDFLENALKMPWLLSTSQTPVSQTKMKPPMCPGGGFGPVAKDGYGVSYIFTGEDMLFFHVTSNRSSLVTDSTKFSEEVRRALWDIRSMFEV